jgi:hypothetical protein
MMWFILFEGIFNVIFIYCLYLLRHIEDQFNINRELKTLLWVKLPVDFLYAGTLIFFYDSTFIVLGFGEYFQIAFCLILLYITAIKPVRRTYEQNSIVPFPINDELISNLESAMLMSSSSKYFHEYIEEELDDMKALSLFSLYVDLRIFYNLLGDPNTKYRQLQDQARIIYDDYVLPGSVYLIPENDIIQDLRNGFVDGKIKFDMNGELFEDLLEFTTSGLTVFY